MKKENILRKFLFALTIPALIVACDNEDEPAAISTDFGTLASTTAEKDGAIVTIPLRNATSSSVSKLGVTFVGSATEGEDFSFVGITEEGVQVKILDDNLLEDTEYVRVQLSGTNGNNQHQITITNDKDCTDEGGLTAAHFAGDFDATEKYGPDPATDWAAPYHVTVTQDATNPNRLTVKNFYGVGDTNTAYFIVDIANRSVYFPDQVTAYKTTANPTPRKITKSSGTFDYCTHNGLLTLTFTLTYDGGEWEYELVKDEPF